MSEPSPTPDWLGAATDLLRERSLDEAANWLETHLTLIVFVEDEIRSQWDESAWQSRRSAIGHAHWGPLLAIVARARGETPERAFERLAPTWHMPDDPPARNPWAAAIDMTRLVERDLERRRQGVEDFLRENNADPAIHEHVIYPAPGDDGRDVDHGGGPPGSPSFASRGHIHALIPWTDTEGRSMRPSRDEVMSRGSRWPWRLI